MQSGSPFRSTHWPQYPVLEHPQSACCPYCGRPSFFFLSINSLQKNTAPEADGRSAGHEIPHHLQNPMFHYRTHNSPSPPLPPPLIKTLSWLNPNLLIIMFKKFKVNPPVNPLKHTTNLIYTQTSSFYLVERATSPLQTPSPQCRCCWCRCCCRRRRCCSCRRRRRRWLRHCCWRRCCCWRRRCRRRRCRFCCRRRRCFCCCCRRRRCCWRRRCWRRLRCRFCCRRRRCRCFCCRCRRRRRCCCCCNVVTVVLVVFHLVLVVTVLVTAPVLVAMVKHCVQITESKIPPPPLSPNRTHKRWTAAWPDQHLPALCRCNPADNALYPTSHFDTTWRSWCRPIRYRVQAPSHTVTNWPAC